MSNFFLLRLRSFGARLYFRMLIAPHMRGTGPNTVFVRPRSLQNLGNIQTGRDVYVADGALLAAVPHTASERCELVIGNGCKLGAHNHIYATHSVVFEDAVLTAGNVYVSDNTHTYDRIDIPIMDQPVRQLSAVRIGRGSWLGQNVCVIGASIGQGCVVGANSVVLSDLPDFCVAVGAPARIIRQLDSDSHLRDLVPAPDSVQKGN